MIPPIEEPLCNVDYIQTDHGNFVRIRYYESSQVGEYIMPAMKFKRFIEKEGVIQRRGDWMIPPVEEQIVDDIISDLSDRRGLCQEWELIDEDIKSEIKEYWINIVKSYLKRGVKDDPPG